MKLAVIFSVLFVQTSASFLSELRNSVSSVGSSLGKLFSDAAVDLKDTFDCTVFAVRQAFSGDSTLPGYEKCQPNVIPLSPSTPIHIIISPIVKPIATIGSEVSTISQPTKKEVKSLKLAAETTSNNKNTKGDEIVKKQSELLDETRLIVNISTKLEREFEELSKSVKDDLTKIEKEQKQLSMDKVMKEIDKLLKEDAVYKNNTDSEIQEISDTITAKLDNNTDKFDLKKEIKLALAELEQTKNQTNVEQDLIKWKDEELKDLNEIRNLLKKQEASKVINKRTIETVATISTKNTEIPNTTPMTSTTTVPTTKATTKSRRKRPKPTETSNTTKPSSTKRSNDYASLETTDKASLDLALKLVDSGKKSEAIMAAILKNENLATSLFDR